MAFAKVNSERDTLESVKGKKLDEERNEAARTFVRRLVTERFGGNRRDAAKAIGISGSLLSEFLSGSRGAGMKLIDGVARVSGCSVDDVLGRATRVEYDRHSRVSASALGNHYQWASARAEAERRWGMLLDSTVLDEEAGASLSRMPEQLTPEFVKMLHDAIVFGRTQVKSVEPIKPKRDVGRRR